MPDPVGPDLQVLPLVSAVDYPLLKRLGKQIIRKFIRDREAYEAEIEERKYQLGTSLGKPVSLKFSIDASVLESLCELGFLGPNIATASDVTDTDIRKWLESHKEVKRHTLSVTQVSSLVALRIKINLSEKDAERRIIMLFAEYASLFRINGLSWIISEHHKQAVAHVLGAIKPRPLKSRLHEDLKSVYKPLAREF
jgi:hypothetical protein